MRAVIKKMLKRTGDALFDQCCWCGITCVWYQKLDKSLIVGKNSAKGGIINFKLEDKVVTFPIVTIEHLLEKSKGGTDRHSNLSTACFKCNSKRSSTKSKKPKNCMDCGTSKVKPSKRRCKDCLEKNKNYYMNLKTIDPIAYLNKSLTKHQ